MILRTFLSSFSLLAVCFFLKLGILGKCGKVAKNLKWWCWLPCILVRNGSFEKSQLEHISDQKKKLKTCQDVEAGSWLSESTQTSLGLHFQLSTKMWMVDFFLMRKHCFHVYWSITFLQKNLSQQKAGRGLLAHVFLSLNVLLSAPALDLKSLRVVMVWTRQHSTLYTEVLQNVICSM